MNEESPPARHQSMRVRRPGVGPSHAWERWAPALHWLFYLVLALATGLAVASTAANGRVAILVLAVAMAGWYWVWAIHRRIWDLPLVRVLVYFAGAAPLFAFLIVLSEAYFLLAFVAYAQVFAFLPTPRSAIPGAVVLTGLMTALTVADTGQLPWLTVILAALSVMVGSGTVLFIDAIMRESEQRHRLIAELEATQRELAAAEREAGVLEERQRLAREIHDTLAQGFTSIVMLLEAAEAEIGSDQTAAARHLDQARRTARESLGEARGVMWALQPEALERTSLPQAIGRIAEQLREETGVASSMVSGTPGQLPRQAETALLRAAQEGLANVRKHAGAKEVVLTLSYVADRVILDIRDDGSGFDLAALADGARNGTGLGLPGMRARMEELGGTLTVESAPGQGTSLAAAVPTTPGRQGSVARPAGGPPKGAVGEPEQR